MEHDELGLDDPGADGSSADKSTISRSKLLKVAGAAGAGVAFGSLTGAAKACSRSSSKRLVDQGRFMLSTIRLTIAGGLPSPLLGDQ